ncbi:MAG TPA: thymidine phosphorylase, partial [Candidatus Thioglobus sp.]|nr:thymidine phosphorylase [Candidatus Thioglobus sp.]
HMLLLSGIESDLVSAKTKSQEALSSGKAASIFEQMIHSLGGPIDLMENANQYLTPMPIISPIVSTSSGYVSEMNAREIGLSMIHLKAGRTKSIDPIDHGVGLSNIVSIGQWVDKGEPLVLAHVREKDQINYLQEILPSIFTLSEQSPSIPNLIYEIISSNKENH